MSVPVSATTRQTLYAQSTGEAFLVLLTIRHADLLDPIRLTSDGVATVRSDGSYQPFPFEIQLPNQNDENDAGVTLTIDIVDRQVIDLLLSIDTAPMLDIEVILASDPESPIVRYPGLRWETSGFNGLTLSGSLRVDDFADEPLAATFTPSRFTALFRS